MAPAITAAAKSLELFGRATGYLRDDAGGTPAMLVVSTNAPQGAETPPANTDEGPVIDICA